MKKSCENNLIYNTYQQIWDKKKKEKKVNPKPKRRPKKWGEPGKQKHLLRPTNCIFTNRNEAEKSDLKYMISPRRHILLRNITIIKEGESVSIIRNRLSKYSLFEGSKRLGDITFVEFRKNICAYRKFQSSVITRKKPV